MLGTTKFKTLIIWITLLGSIDLTADFTSVKILPTDLLLSQ